MKKLIKDLWLIILLILMASVVLLLSDSQNRSSATSGKKQNYPSIAMMQISSTGILDAHTEGVIDRLRERGFVAEGMKNISRFNAQGDFSAANSIAKEIVTGTYQMVITSSTVATQVMARANQQTGKIHVFGAVTDPYGAGVGISGPEPEQHPPYMVGIGTFQPVDNTFKLIKELNPAIRRIGVVWNPGEQCSEACMRLARDFCKTNQIQLIEAVATNTSEVPEAIKSLLAKGVEAIWIGGDTVASSSVGLIVSQAITSKVPVFTNDPSDVSKGALFGLGADYYTVGQYTADVAVAILEGVSPVTLRIENVIPERFDFNRQTFDKLDTRWKISPTIQALLDKNSESSVNESVTVDFAEFKNQGVKPGIDLLEKADHFLNLIDFKGRPVKVAIITLVENRLLEEAANGAISGLTESGLRLDVDFTLKKYSAQGEIGQLPQIIESAINAKSDVIITITTLALIAAAKRVIDIPLVFSVASKPERLGLFQHGRPSNICGVFDDPPVDQLLDMAVRNDPALKIAGTIYDPSQPNSLISVEKLRASGAERNIKIVEATAASVTELGTGTQSLLQRGAKALIVSADNLVSTGFSTIIKATSPANVPVYVTEPALMEQGARAAIGDDFFEWGMQSGKMAAKILAGVPPSKLPIEKTKIQHTIDPGKAIPVNKSTAPFKLRIVLYSETEFAERCREGLLDGIKNAGLSEGRDYSMKIFNAQGDMSTLSSIMNTVKSDRADLLMVVSTPTLQAALRQAGTDTKIVFTGVGDAVRAGAGKTETDHLPNVTGITTRSPFSEMAKLIKETIPGTRRVGTLFTPAEINSELYMNWFKEALAAEGIELVTMPVTQSADVAQATISLCGKNIDVLAQIVDNLTRPGFALIARKAAEKSIPVYVFDSDQMKDGGVICLARDYYNAGLEAAELAVRVLNGENPKNIPFRNTKSEKLIINKELATKFNLRITHELLSRAIVYQPENK